jgi:hypothetical protein
LRETSRTREKRMKEKRNGKKEWKQGKGPCKRDGKEKRDGKK